MYCASWCFQKVPVQDRVPCCLLAQGFQTDSQSQWEVAPELLTVQKGPTRSSWLADPCALSKCEIPDLDQPWFESQKTSSDRSVLFPRGFQKAWHKLCLLSRVLFPLNASVCFHRHCYDFESFFRILRNNRPHQLYINWHKYESIFLMHINWYHNDHSFSLLS